MLSHISASNYVLNQYRGTTNQSHYPKNELTQKNLMVTNNLTKLEKIGTTIHNTHRDRYILYISH